MSRAAPLMLPRIGGQILACLIACALRHGAVQAAIRHLVIDAVLAVRAQAVHEQVFNHDHAGAGQGARRFFERLR